MKDNFTGYYCTLPKDLKENLKSQAYLERKSVVSLIQEFCISGLHIRNLKETERERIKVKPNPLEEVGFLAGGDGNA